MSYRAGVEGEIESKEMQKPQNLPIPAQLRRKANIICVEKSYRHVIRWIGGRCDQVDL